MLVRTAENIKDPLFRFFEREVGLLGQILKVSSYIHIDALLCIINLGGLVWRVAWYICQTLFFMKRILELSMSYTAGEQWCSSIASGEEWPGWCCPCLWSQEEADQLLENSDQWLGQRYIYMQCVAMLPYGYANDDLTSFPNRVIGVDIFETDAYSTDVS